MSSLFRHKVYKPVLVESPKNPVDVTWRVGDSWRHVTDSEEGFKSASCSLSGDRSFLRAWFESNLGGHWVLEDLSTREVWSGMVWSMRLVDEGWEQTRSLDSFANRIRVLYQSTVTGERLHVPSATTWYEDTDSQAIFGIRELTHTIGESTATRAAGLGALMLAENPWPGRSKNKTEAGGTTLAINLRGYMATLGWRMYNDTTSGTDDCDSMVDTIVTAVSEFIPTVTAEANTFQFPSYHNRDRYSLSILRDLVSLGDGTDPWIIGVYENRVLRYEARNTDYNMVWNKGFPTPSRLDGSVVSPWLIRPNDVIRVPWLIPGYLVSESPDRDPTTLVVKEVSFSSPYQVSVVGSHDERIEVMLNRIQRTRW